MFEVCTTELNGKRVGRRLQLNVTRSLVSFTAPATHVLNTKIAIKFLCEMNVTHHGPNNQ